MTTYHWETEELGHRVACGHRHRSARMAGRCCARWSHRTTDGMALLQVRLIVNGGEPTDAQSDAFAEAASS